MSSQRIALVASSFLPHLGGVEEHTRAVAVELARRGHDVEVWAADRGRRLGEGAIPGVRVRYLPTPLPHGSLAGVAAFVRHLPGAAWQWWRAYRHLRPEVLHVQCFGPNGVYALLLRTMTRRPLVVSSHGETVADDHNLFVQSWQVRTALTRAMAVADTVTGCSAIVARDLTETFGRTTVVVVPNGVDVGGEGDLVGLTGEDTDAARPGPLVLAVGRLEHVKGFDLLIEAFRCAVIDPETRLVIVGDGTQQHALRRLVDESGLTERVRLTGAQGSERVKAWMARADVVVVPSRREAFGMVALEAWAAGAPLVATALTGPAEFVEDGVDGVLVDPTVPDALARAIGRVLNDPALARHLIKGGRRRVGDFTWTRVADDYEAIYRQVIPR